MQPANPDTSTSPMSGSAADTPGGEPAEGRPDLGIPGADREDRPSGAQDDLPERLGERIENGSSSGIAPGEPDVLPDVEVPEETM
jgi:hypothetical protein